MIFHLLVGDSHEIAYLIFCQKLGKMSQNLSSAAVVIGALRVKRCLLQLCVMCIHQLFAETEGSGVRVSPASLHCGP